MAVRRDRPDYFSRKARQEQFASRAVYKLADIDRRYRLFRPGLRVLDLGCAPGSWLQYLSSRVGPQGLVVGVDQQPLTGSLGPPVVFQQADITTLTPEDLRSLSTAFDVVVSDLAPATSGVKDVDHQRSLALARRAWEFAKILLAPGGHFLVKVFEGPDFPAFVAAIRPHFRRTTLIKPTASRQESREMYVLGQQKREQLQT
ncbi:MAG: RlmE family RNA methyltransferase [Desulfobacca sp.]|uniref:RlmE family RNA methyltransferase n=1 Tax=Desulfobacca sp. TaxID=2067990 RepID=UPI00404987DF